MLEAVVNGRGVSRKLSTGACVCGWVMEHTGGSQGGGRQIMHDLLSDSEPLSTPLFSPMSVEAQGFYLVMFSLIFRGFQELL
jgi:hypothetical protein